MTGRILFLSLDGLLQPLGRSQIVTYIQQLARRGRRYAVVSCERRSDLDDIARVQELRAELQHDQIDWFPVTYSTGGRTTALLNLGRLAAQVRSIIAREPVLLMHARSYVAGGIALGIKSRYGIPYILDTRGYWLEEKRDSGKWFANPLVFDLANRIERRLYIGAAGIVGLTQLSIDDFHNGAFGKSDTDALAVNIPTATDGNLFAFDRSKTPPDHVYPLGNKLREKLVIGYVGSVNKSYPLSPCLELFVKIRSLREDAHFLAITAQQDELRHALTGAGVSDNDFTVVTSDYHDMPRWLSCIDWGLLILSDGWSKRASMPTKLAEFLAVGIRPIQFGCNSEVGDWIDKTGSGLRLDSQSSAALDDAAKTICDAQEHLPSLRRAREIAESHFGIGAALDRYDSLIHAVLRNCCSDSAGRA